MDMDKDLGVIKAWVDLYVLVVPGVTSSWPGRGGRTMLEPLSTATQYAPRQPWSGGRGGGAQEEEGGGGGRSSAGMASDTCTATEVASSS